MGHRRQARAIVARGTNVKRGLNTSALNAKAFRMSEQSRKNLSREERLAAQLRENLRRRKAQSKAIARAAGGSASESDAQALPKPATGS
jgi:hypothetical protein